MFKKFLSKHEFFCEFSRPYIFGGWDETIPWWKDDNKFNTKKLFYYVYFPIAYVKFMISSLKGN